MFEKDLEKVYSKKEWQRQWSLFHLFRKWDTVVGDQSSRITMPAFFRRDVLWIYVRNSSWMQHLQYIKPDILEGVKRVLPDFRVGDVQFALFPSDLPWDKTKSFSSPRRLSPEAEEDFKGLVQSIGDDTCREALYNLWQAHEKLGRE